jgi:hypothetical protein
MDIRQVPFAAAAIEQARPTCPDVVAGYAAGTSALCRSRPLSCSRDGAIRSSRGQAIAQKVAEIVTGKS